MFESRSGRWVVLIASVWLGAAPFANAQTTTGVADDGTATDGQSLWTSKGCSGCHGLTGARANAANAGAHITYANTQGMGAAALTTTERNNIAAYIAANMTTTLATQTVSFEGSKAVVAPGFTLNTSYGDYIGLRTANNLATRGTVSYSGTTITYTANPDQCGTDTFSYEAYRSGASVQGTGTSNERTVTFDIADPAAPNISTSASTKVGTYNTAISNYTPTSTGGATRQLYRVRLAQRALGEFQYRRDLGHPHGGRRGEGEVARWSSPNGKSPCLVRLPGQKCLDRRTSA